MNEAMLAVIQALLQRRMPQQPSVLSRINAQPFKNERGQRAPTPPMGGVRG